MREVSKMVEKQGKIEKAMCCGTCENYGAINCTFWLVKVEPYERCDEYKMNQPLMYLKEKPVVNKA